MYKEDDAERSNFIIDIKNGKMTSGNIDKSVLGGCHQRINSTNLQ